MATKKVTNRTINANANNSLTLDDLIGTKSLRKIENLTLGSGKVVTVHYRPLSAEEGLELFSVSQKLEQDESDIEGFNQMMELLATHLTTPSGEPLGTKQQLLKMGMDDLVNIGFGIMNAISTSGEDISKNVSRATPTESSPTN